MFRKFIFTIIAILLFHSLTFSQCRIPNSSIIAKAYLGGRQLSQSVSKEELVKSDLQILLEGKDLKVTTFKACHDCHSGYTRDINCQDYAGNVIFRGDSFIKDIEVGNLLVLDCIVSHNKQGKFQLAAIVLEVTP